MPMSAEVFAKNIENLPHLTQLDLSHQQLTVADLTRFIEELNHYPAITTLDLTGNFLGDDCIKPLEQLIYISDLILVANKITDAVVSGFAAMQALTSLDLNLNDLSDQGADLLAEHSRLRWLSLNGNHLTAQGLIVLAKSPSLVSLALMNNGIHSINETLFVNHTNLKRLFLDNNYLHDDDISTIARHPHLTELSLANNNITEKGAVFLATLFQGQSLNVSNNRVGDHGASVLVENKAIKVLSLSNNHLSHRCADGFHHNSTLTQLDLSYNQVNGVFIKQLANNEQLTSLNLTQNAVNVVALEALIPHASLKTLNLSYNRLNDACAVAISKNTSITHLNLTGNCIGEAGAVALSKMAQLTALTLNYNNIGDVGAAAISHSVSIQELHLSYNQISDKGGMAFIENKKSIQNLFLNYNQISSECQVALMNHFPKDTVICSDEQPISFAKDNVNNIFLITKGLFCIINNKGKIQFFNACFTNVLGYEAEELLAKPLVDFIHPLDRPLTETIFNEPIAEDVILRLMSKEGDVYIISWCFQWQEERIYLTGTDLSAQKKAESVRESIIQKEMQQAKDFSLKQAEFIAHLCHEIRNPVSSVLGSIDVITEYLFDITNATKLLQGCSLLKPEEVIALADINTHVGDIKKTLTAMKGCCRHQELILNDNLDIAKIADGKLQLNKKPLNLNQLINDLVAMNSAKVSAKGLELTLHAEYSDENLVKGDLVRLKQIILNLLTNAIKFTAKGKIDVSLSLLERRDNRNYFSIAVKDTGIGLTAEEISLLFDSYAQANITVGSQYGGSGLGLYIAKQLAKLMDGDIHIQSELNKGSVFTCIFACERLSDEEKKQLLAASKVLSSPSVPVSALRRLPGYRVLVVEDNKINIKTLVFMLTKAGHSCLLAHDGMEALDTYKEKHAVLDVILMDTYMPKMNGLEAIAAIREFEKQQQLPRKVIISLSGNALARDQRLAFAAGADGYLVKPAKKEELLSQMHRLVSQVQTDVDWPLSALSPIAPSLGARALASQAVTEMSMLSLPEPAMSADVRDTRHNLFMPLPEASTSSSTTQTASEVKKNEQESKTRTDAPHSYRR